MLPAISVRPLNHRLTNDEQRFSRGTMGSEPRALRRPEEAAVLGRDVYEPYRISSPRFPGLLLEEALLACTAGLHSIRPAALASQSWTGCAEKSSHLGDSNNRIDRCQRGRPPLRRLLCHQASIPRRRLQANAFTLSHLSDEPLGGGINAFQRLQLRDYSKFLR